MFRRVVVTIITGLMLASLCCMAQDTSAQTPSGSSSPAQAASTQSGSNTSVQSSTTQNSSTTTITHSSSKKAKKKNKKSVNPIADVDSKQPDKVLYDRAMDAIKHGKYDVASESGHRPLLPQLCTA